MRKDLWLMHNRDTFVGACASNYLQQKSQLRWDVKEAVERASRVSAWIIGAIGAQAATPWSDQIDSIKAKWNAQGKIESDQEQIGADNQTHAVQQET